MGEMFSSRHDYVGECLIASRKKYVILVTDEYVIEPNEPKPRQIFVALGYFEKDLEEIDSNSRLRDNITNTKLKQEELEEIREGLEFAFEGFEPLLIHGEDALSRFNEKVKSRALEISRDDVETE